MGELLCTYKSKDQRYGPQPAEIVISTIPQPSLPHQTTAKSSLDIHPNIVDKDLDNIQLLPQLKLLSFSNVLVNKYEHLFKNVELVEQIKLVKCQFTTLPFDHILKVNKLYLCKLQFPSNILTAISCFKWVAYLTVFDICYCNIADYTKDLSILLQNCSSLANLSIVSCGISDESLKNLKLPPLLKRLSLVDNNISDAGAAIIREGCPPRMEELVLNLNFIKDIATACSLFDSLNIKIISDLQKYTSTQISERIRADFIYLLL